MQELLRSFGMGSCLQNTTKYQHSFRPFNSKMSCDEHLGMLFGWCECQFKHAEGDVSSHLKSMYTTKNEPGARWYFAHVSPSFRPWLPVFRPGFAFLLPLFRQCWDFLSPVSFPCFAFIGYRNTIWISPGLPVLFA